MSRDEIFKQRAEKAELLKAEGIEPYGRAFDHRPAGSLKEGDSAIQVAGRIMAIRRHGKASFLDVRDSSGKIQVYLRNDILPEKDYRIYSLADIGDIIGVSGDVFRTRTGELTMKAVSFTILAKALLSLPEKWHGLTDVEIRFRKRYLDLIMNPAARAVAEKRVRMLATLRQDLAAMGFIEVETPMMHPIPGGAEARPFVTHHHALDMDLYLRVAPELYLKRLLVGGFERVFEMNRSFRNEGISPLHNPEFTMLEVYEAYADYRRMMRITEDLLTHLLDVIVGSLTHVWQGTAIDFSPPWRQVTWIDCLRQAGIVNWSDLAEAQSVADHLRIEIPAEDRDDLFEVLDHIFKKAVQPALINPTYVTEYPKVISPLAKSCPDDPSMTERFELYIGGLEVANAYSELNDPREQQERFLAQARTVQPGRVKVVDEDYIEALSYGMPPAGGLGIGIDRLAMLLTGSATLREVILFPQMRPRR